MGLEGVLGSLVELAFQTSGNVVGVFPLSQSHLSESVLDYFPELGRVELLVGEWAGPA